MFSNRNRFTAVSLNFRASLIALPNNELLVTSVTCILKESSTNTSTPEVIFFSLAGINGWQKTRTKVATANIRVSKISNCCTFRYRVVTSSAFLITAALVNRIRCGRRSCNRCTTTGTAIENKPNKNQGYNNCICSGKNYCANKLALCC